MDLDQFKKLEDSIKEESFGRDYKNINVVLFFLSIFGNLASIFLAYFLLSKILASAIINNPILVLVASVILLSGLELLKRDIFQKFSTQLIKFKTIADKNVYPLLFASILVVCISFYATISGAKEFSSKEKEIENVAEQTSQKYEDSLTNVYNLKIADVEKENKDAKSKLDQKDAEETSIESVLPLTPQQRSRVRDLKSQKDQLRIDIANNDTSINRLKSELSTKISEYQTKINDISGKKKTENKTNSFLFICISTMIELIILAGVYFNRYYKVRTYNEYRTKIEKDPNYQKWITYTSLLDTLYNVDTKINDKIPAIKTIVELSKLNNINILKSDAEDFVKVLSSLGVLKVNGGTKYIAKSKDSAKEILKNHFNVK